MELLAHNLSQLKLAPLLKEQVEQHQPTDAVHIQMIGGGKFVMQYKGTDLYKSDQPVLEAAQDIQRIVGDAEQDLVVFLGFGFGLHAEFIKKRFEAPLIVFEPDMDILKTSLSLRPFNIENLYIENNFGRLFDLVDTILNMTDNRVIVATHPFYRESFPEKYKRFREVVTQAIENVHIRQNTVKKGEVWAEYELANLKDSVFLPSVLDLKKYCKNIPGIIVGAGPSLAKNIELLRAAKGKALIIAATTALRPLEDAGIIPDVSVVIEANDHRYQFEGLKRLDEVTIAATPFSNPYHYQLPVKHTYSVLTRPSPVHDWLVRAYEKVDSVQVGGSVALVGYSILHQIGCDPIVLVGMDLAYTNLETHVKGTKSSAIVVRHNEQTSKLDFFVASDDALAIHEALKKGLAFNETSAVPCTSWGGEGEVFTESVLNTYRGWLEGTAETWAADRTLINATEGGARIYGFQETPLAEVLDNHCQVEYPIDEWLDAVANDYVPPDLALLKQTIEEEYRLIERVMQLAKKCEVRAQRVIKLVQKKSLKKAQQELNVLSGEEKEMGMLSTKTRILNQISQHAANAIRLERHQDKHENELIQMTNALKRSVLLFKEIHRGAQTSIQLFEQALHQFS